MDFRKLLSENKFVYLDGGMGTMLQASGLELGGIPEMLNFTNPGLIQSVHRQYAEAGSQIVYANTFGANRHKMAGTGKTISEIIGKAVENARKGCEGTSA